MTSAHVLYIPTIFMLGLVTGMLLKSPASDNKQIPDSPISGKVLLGSFLIFAIVFIGTHFFYIPKSAHAVTKALNGAEIFDKKPSFTSGEVYARIASFPQAGIYLYKQFTYTMDVLFPITLFAFLVLLTQYISQRAFLSKRFRIALALIPVIWFLLDMAENAMVYGLLDTYPAKNFALAGSLGYVTMTKFSFLLLSIASPAMIKAFEKTIVRRIRQGNGAVVL
jgi:hypothetical protein